MEIGTSNAVSAANGIGHLSCFWLYLISVIYRPIMVSQLAAALWTSGRPQNALSSPLHRCHEPIECEHQYTLHRMLWQHWSKWNSYIQHRLNSEMKIWRFDGYKRSLVSKLRFQQFSFTTNTSGIVKLNRISESLFWDNVYRGMVILVIELSNIEIEHVAF